MMLFGKSARNADMVDEVPQKQWPQLVSEAAYKD
jgi:hypothetical protein